MRQFLAQYAGPIALAVGLIASLDGRWAVAVPVLALGVMLLWLSAGWALPGSADAYMRRVSRVFDDWQAYEHWAHHRGAPEDSPAPPDELRADHERLLGLRAEYAAAWTDPDPLPDRARRAAMTHKAAREVFEGIRDRATSDAGRRYVAEWEASRTARREYDARAIAEFEHTVESKARRLEQIKPPAAAAPEHAALVQSLRDHRAAGRELHDAVLAADPDRAATAGAAWDDTGRDLQNHGHRVAARLGRGSIWPAADDA
jgi:hypothetical protein